MEKVVKGSGEDDWAVPIENVEDGARKVKVGSLNHLGGPELKDGVNSEHDLEEGENFSGRVILKDMFASDSKEGNKLRSVG